jgi:hypothetical protein
MELEEGDVVAMAVNVSSVLLAHAVTDCSSEQLSIQLLTFCISLVAFKDQVLWRSFPADRVLLSEGGAVATHTTGEEWSLTTTETELTEGKHYWEVEQLSKWWPHIGISRPNLDPTGRYGGSQNCTDGWFICTGDGALYGNGKYVDDHAGYYDQGDRVGMLLDLDNGSLRFFKNGVQHGPGYAAGSVTGPVVAAVQMYHKDSVRLLPNAEAPAVV